MRTVGFSVAPAAALVLCACAQDPKSIAPAYVSQVPYQSWSCQQLGEEAARIDSALVSASAQQTNARGADTAGIILLGLPVSSMSGGNIAPQVAQLKGQKNAVETVMITKSCAAPQVTPKVARQ